MVDLLKMDLLDMLDWEESLRGFFVIPKKRPVLVGLSKSNPEKSQNIPDFKEKA